MLEFGKPWEPPKTEETAHDAGKLMAILRDEVTAARVLDADASGNVPMTRLIRKGMALAEEMVRYVEEHPETPLTREAAAEMFDKYGGETSAAMYLRALHDVICPLATVASTMRAERFADTGE